jgi:hypothetical protein
MHPLKVMFYLYGGYTRDNTATVITTKKKPASTQPIALTAFPPENPFSLCGLNISK